MFIELSNGSLFNTAAIEIIEKSPPVGKYYLYLRMIGGGTKCVPRENYDKIIGTVKGQSR